MESRTKPLRASVIVTGLHFAKFTLRSEWTSVIAKQLDACERLPTFRVYSISINSDTKALRSSRSAVVE